MTPLFLHRIILTKSVKWVRGWTQDLNLAPFVFRFEWSATLVCSQTVAAFNQYETLHEQARHISKLMEDLLNSSQTLVNSWLVKCTKWVICSAPIAKCWENRFGDRCKSSWLSTKHNFSRYYQQSGAKSRCK